MFPYYERRDLFREGEHMAIITGTPAGSELLTGTNANDVIHDGLTVGAPVFGDTMVGSFGNDTYYVNNLLDSITENVGEGTDTVISSVDYTLDANVENLRLTGAAHIGIGNDWNNTITGTAGGDTLDGGEGADYLVGGRQ
jgi:Ca2+-binding RTX toxin-like protein